MSTPPFPSLLPGSMASANKSHGHSHSGGDDHGHAHDDHSSHGHSHAGGDDHSHSHGGDHSHSHAGSGSGGGDAHGHSHGGQPCTGHHAEEEDAHGHSHAGGSAHGHSHHTFDNSSISGSSGGALSAASVRSGGGVRKSWPLWWSEQSKLIHSDRDAKRLFYFIALNVCFMFIQLLYGLYVYNLGLITGSFHTGFDCLALASSLAAMIVSKRQAEFAFSYGYDRFEVLAGFTNAIFLIFVAIFLIFESAHLFYNPTPNPKGDGALGMAALGLCLDAVGMALFHRHSHVFRRGGGGRLDLSGSDRGGRESNLVGVFLHILADIMHHIAHITAVFLVYWRGWTLSHGVLSLFIAVLIIRTVYPLFQYTGLMLLQTTPPNVQLAVEKATKQIAYYDGVLECKDMHWWSQSPGVTIGSLHIRIQDHTHEAAVLAYANSLLGKYITHLTVQIVKDQPLMYDSFTAKAATIGIPHGGDGGHGHSHGHGGHDDHHGHSH